MILQVDVANNTAVKIQCGYYCVLKFTYRVMIDICINYSGRGRSKIYGIYGYLKSYLGQKMCTIVTEEYNNE